MIKSLRCQGECDGYETEAKRRGIAAHEVNLLAEQRIALLRRRRGTGGRVQ